VGGTRVYLGVKLEWGGGESALGHNNAKLHIGFSVHDGKEFERLRRGENVGRMCENTLVKENLGP